MADISIIGYIKSTRIVNDNNNIAVEINEYVPSYTHTKTLKKVDAKMVRWSVLFGTYYIKFIRGNFHNGNLVQVKGTILPYDQQDGQRIGIYGETIKVIKPPYNLDIDKKREKKSQKNFDDTPNLQDYIQDDF